MQGVVIDMANGGDDDMQNDMGDKQNGGNDMANNEAKTAKEVALSLLKVRNSLPSGIRLVAVSKFHSMDKILAAYNEGQRVFGESHERELSQKAEALPKDIEWHFIGHLQTNKVKYIAPYIRMIDAVDTMKLLREVNKQAAKCHRTIDVLLELHIAEEATKYGFSMDGLWGVLERGEHKELPNVRICGLMTMATQTDDEAQIAKEFATAAVFFDKVKERFFASDEAFRERSWGMSHDYPIAIKHQSTMVRVGTMIFGEREY